jgi:hypothetical protein
MRAAALAAIYLAREEILAETEEAPIAVQRAVNACKTITAPEVIAALERVRTQYSDMNKRE